MSEYEPGTVAVVEGRRAMLIGKRWCWDDGGWVIADMAASVHPLVVVDPEDREQVGSLIDAYVDVMQADNHSGNKRGAILKMQAALRSLVRPPKPEVYEHLVYQQRGKTAESVCGKAWIPGADVTVAGRCPECQQIAMKGWTA